MPSTARNPRSTRRGFALVELLIVMVLIGILAAIAYPSISAMRWSAEAAMLQIGTTLQSAQREAVARQYDVVIQFDATNSRLRIIYDVNGNGAADGGERVRGVSLEKYIVFGRGGAPARSFGAGPVTLSDGTQTLIFHRNGSASASGGLYLTSTRAAAGEAKRVRDARAIEIVRSTGRIEWFRYNDPAWLRGF